LPNNCNMETPRKQLSKYWCSVPHCLSDIRNIYIKADRFPFMMLTANKYMLCYLNTVVSNPFHSVKFCYFRPPDHVISMECTALDFRCQCTQQKLQSICAVLSIINNCNMETPRKQLSKYWCSVPHCLCDIRNIYIKADRFPCFQFVFNYIVCLLV
jgi:DNA-directed RNA polymerase subunit L